MPDIVDLDELVPDDIQFNYRGETYTIPGDLRVDQTLDLYALLTRLANAEAKGGAAEMKRILDKAEAALLPVFQVHQPEMVQLPFGAAGLGHVLRRVLTLIGLLQVVPPGDGDDTNPPTPAPAPGPRKPRGSGSSSTRKTTKPGSRKPRSRPKSAGSSR